MPPLPHRQASDPRCHYHYFAARHQILDATTTAAARHQIPDATITTLPPGIRSQMPPSLPQPPVDPRCHHHYFAARHQIPDATITTLPARHQIPDTTIASPPGIRSQMPPLCRPVSDPRCRHHRTARYQIPDDTTLPTGIRS